MPRPALLTSTTVKSQSSAHGRSQLKPKKKSGLCPYTENLLECLNELLASAHPRLPNLLRQSRDLLLYKTRNGAYTSHHHFTTFENYVRVHHRQRRSRISCLQVSVDARNRRRALHSSGDIKHAWPLCSRHTEGYTDKRACYCWGLQSLLFFSETWGYNQVQSVNWQTPSFAVGARRARSSMQTNLCRQSEAIEEAQEDRITCIH